MTKKYIGDQGEISIFKIDALPDCETEVLQKSLKGHIVSHSENGSHHILSDGELLERKDVPEGMKIFYGILNQTEELFQDSSNPHDKYELDKGIYEFRIARGFDPFTEVARRVAD